jgi:hypothetical protein
MTIAVIVVVCVVLAALAFLLPRLSRRPQRGVSKTLGAGERAAGSAPGAAGRLLRKPFQKSREATNRSAEAGRRARYKVED